MRKGVTRQAGVLPSTAVEMFQLLSCIVHFELQVISVLLDLKSCSYVSSMLLSVHQVGDTMQIAQCGTICA